MCIKAATFADGSIVVECLMNDYSNTLKYIATNYSIQFQCKPKHKSIGSSSMCKEIKIASILIVLNLIY